MPRTVDRPTPEDASAPRGAGERGRSVPSCGGALHRARIAACVLLLVAGAAVPLGARGPGPGSAAGVRGALAEPAEASPSLLRRRAPKALKVKRFLPRHTSSRVPLSATVTVDFGEALDPASIRPGMTVRLARLGGAAVPFTWALERDARRLVLTPSEPFEPSLDYEVVVLPGIFATSGRTLRDERRAIFFTEPRRPLSLLSADQFTIVEDRLAEPRASHSCSLLPSGRALLAGGQVDGILFAASLETFDPRTDRFNGALPLVTGARSSHAAVVSGNVAYLIGGWDGVDAIGTTEVYDDVSRTTGPGPALLEKRDFVAAVTLADGRVLATGGLSYVGSGAVYSSTAEILGDTGAWRRTAGNPVRRRAGHTLTLLDDGRVLVTGGTTESSGFAPSAELFDPVTETFTTIPVGPRWHRQQHSATVLRDGRVLLADGGIAVVEVFDPVTAAFETASGASFRTRNRATASLLEDGRVLFVGGVDTRADTVTPLDGIDLFDPDKGTVGTMDRVNLALSPVRGGHAATTLTDGRVLVTGGFDPAATGTNLDTGLLFTPR